MARSATTAPGRPSTLCARWSVAWLRPYDTFVDSLRPFLAKRLTECGGLILFTGAVALTVALATWSINDRSGVNDPVRLMRGG
jgi:hypothetical protein